MMKQFLVFYIAICIGTLVSITQIDSFSFYHIKCIVSNMVSNLGAVLLLGPLRKNLWGELYAETKDFWAIYLRRIG